MRPSLDGYKIILQQVHLRGKLLHMLRSSGTRQH